MLNQDEVLKMATEAGLCYESNGFIDWIDAGPALHEMILFAKLVADAAAAKERVACFDAAYEEHATTVVLEAIRARGQ